MHTSARFFFFAVPFVLALTFPISTLANGEGSAQLMAQLTQFNGGCPPNPSDDPAGCIDVQFSIHRAPVCANGPNALIGDTYSISMVREFSSALAGGSSTLVRADDGLAFNLSTTGLAPNAPYTVWFVGFNPGNPCIVEGGECTCGGEDIDSVFWGTGGMTDSLGSATFTGNINYGELPGGIDQVPFPGFANPVFEGAEIHFVIRAHGPALKGNGGLASD